MNKLTLTALAAAMTIAGTAQADTTIGGYGELHYNNLQSNVKSDTRDIDFHRFVLFFGHEFDENIRMFSEFELEHSIAGEGKAGEVELEQAYIEMDLNDSTQLKAGVMLVPVGIMNETHEPPTFYGTERNPVEKNIIPATWWEGGLGLSGQFGEGFSYDFMIHSGLKVDLTSSKGDIYVRGGRQKVGKADANNAAYTGRIKYTGIQGLELASTVSVQDDITQDATDAVEGATLFEAHAIYNVGAATFKALYAAWDIDTTSAATTAQKQADAQNGFYVEAGYKLTEKIGVFTRHNEWETEDVAGQDANTQLDFGVNYWPHENVVFKADFQQQNTASGDYDGINLAVGYQF